METPTKAKILKIYVSSTDRVNKVLLYETIARKAKEFGMQGVTALRARLGYGPSSELRSTRFFELVEKFPIVLELVDVPEKIDGFIDHIKPFIESQPKGCLMASHEINVHLVKKGEGPEEFE